MHSMAAASAGDTTTPQEDSAAADVFMAVWNFLARLLPGGSLTLMALIAGACWLAQESRKHRRYRERPQRDYKAYIATAKALARTLKALARFLSGKELRGEPRSDATFFRAGRRTHQADASAAVMASVAAPPPKVSLVKKTRRPRPWARTTAAWIQGYSGHGATALDKAVTTLLWAVRAAGKTWRALTAVYGAIAPPVARLARVLGAWSRWPYALRGLARTAAVAAVVGLAVPAWRGWTVVGMVAAIGLLMAVSALWQPPRPSDDEVYGPRIWAILADDLKLPDDAVRTEWLRLPERLDAADARIVVRLPWNFRGSEIERQQVTDLLNSRLPGEWIGRYSFRDEHFKAVYTHKPPPKPKEPDPEPPSAVDINEPRVWETLAALKPEEFFLGYDAHNEPVIRKMSGELSHWAYSVGSGGGKSTTLQWLAVQMVMKCGTVLGVDPKLISLKPLEGVQAVFLYADPENAMDMRRSLEWAAEVVAARFYEVEQGTETEFPPLYIFLEETNELSGLLKALWNRVRIKAGEEKDPAGDPIWEDVIAYILRFGRAANVHIIAVFQDFKDNQFGGTSLQPLFRLKVLGNYDPRQWERITGMSKTVMPPNVDKAGRMVTVEQGKPVSFQTPYFFIETEDGAKRPATEAEAIELYGKLYRELRERHGYSDRGLYTAPPANSPRGVPRLLRARMGPASRDEGPNGAQGAPEGGQGDETAGHLSREGDHVTPAGGLVTAQRDGLRLIPGQGGRGPQGAAEADPTAPPELLPLAEICRRVGPSEGVPKYDTVRQHKARRDDFPQPTVISGKELFTLSQIRAYYEAQEKEA